jgi:hypothetical protein
VSIDSKPHVTAFMDRAKAALADLEPFVAAGSFVSLVLHTPGQPEAECVITRAPDVRPIVETLQRSILREPNDDQVQPS